MFCQNPTCGTELASHYKFCPNCGGKNFGPQQVKRSQPFSMPLGGGNQLPSGNLPKGSSGNSSSDSQKKWILIGVGVVVALLLFSLVYQNMKAAEMQASIRQQQEIAKFEAERKKQEEVENERKRLEAEELAKQQALLAAQLKKEREDAIRTEVEKRSLAVVERKGSQILASAYPLAMNALHFQSADPRGAKKIDGGYVATIRLNYLNLLSSPHYLDIAFNYNENGESQEWKIVEFSDFIAPNKLTVEALIQLIR